MEVRDWVTLGSALIIVLGWFVNSWLNRKHEIAKKKLEYRLNALQSFMPLASLLVSNNPDHTDVGSFDKLWGAYINIQLYGTEKEVVLMNQLYESIKDKDLQKMKVVYPQLYDCIRANLRKELGIKS